MINEQAEIKIKKELLTWIAIHIIFHDSPELNLEHKYALTEDLYQVFVRCSQVK